MSRVWDGSAAVRPIVATHPSETWAAFVDYWKKFYDYPDEEEFLRRTGQRPWTRGDILWFFQWKNGMRLSKKKRSGQLEKIVLPAIAEINLLRADFRLEQFQTLFGAVSPIWRIFLLFLVSGGQFPIFDQHTWRARCFLVDGVATELPSSYSKIDALYFERYVPFVQGLTVGGLDGRDLDRALFMFGRFLRTPFRRMIDLP